MGPNIKYNSAPALSIMQATVKNCSQKGSLRNWRITLKTTIQVV